MAAPDTQGNKVEPLDAAPAADGISRGTTYSCSGVGKKDGAETTASDQGYRTTTSYVASAGTQRLIDDAAKNQDAHNPKNHLLDAKRVTGQQLADPIVNPENTALDAKRSTGRKFADHTVQPNAEFVTPKRLTGRKFADPIVQPSVEYETPVKGPLPTAEAVGADDDTKEAVDANDVPLTLAVDSDKVELELDLPADVQKMFADMCQMEGISQSEMLTRWIDARWEALPAALPADVVPEFADIPCFVGRLPGMAFKTGHRGLGYYRDVRGGPLKECDGHVLARILRAAATIPYRTMCW